MMNESPRHFFQPGKLPLALAAVFAFNAGLAQADALQDLTARIDALQKEVAELRKQQVVAAPVNAVTGGSTAGSFKLPGSNTSVTLGGYAKLDTIYTSRSAGVNSASDQNLDVTAIPVGPGAGANETRQLTMHARQSRLFLNTQTPSAMGDVNTRLEWDLFGTSGNEVASNSHNLRLRHAYGSIGGFLAGQTWSNFMVLGASADTLDFGGPVAVPFVRQAQVRWTQPYSLGQWSVALENPETTLGAIPRPDDDRFPDLTGNIQFKTSVGQFWLTGLARQLRIDTAAAQDSRGGGGIGFSGAIPAFGKDMFRFGLNGGNALGRYWGGVFQDAFLDAGGKLKLANQSGATVSYQHFWSDQLRSSVALGSMYINNPAFAPGTTNKRFSSAHLNLIWSPIKNTDLGVEYMYGRRETENGLTGSVNRLQASAQYSF